VDSPAAGGKTKEAAGGDNPAAGGATKEEREKKREREREIKNE